MSHAPGSFADRLWREVQPTLDAFGLVLIDSWCNEREGYWQFTFRDGDGRVAFIRILALDLKTIDLDPLATMISQQLRQAWPGHALAAPGQVTP